jgi:hypothetical protein
MEKTRLIRLAALGFVAAMVFATSALADPPKNVSAPTIDGKPVVGKTLTAGNGIWQNNPTSYAYQWLRCDANGNNCGKIGGATAKTYTVATSDVGSTLMVWVTAKNSSGSTGPVNSKPTAVVAPATAPTNTTLPSIKGIAQVGQALFADPGKYSGGAVDKFTFQWQRCGRNGGQCVDSSGATGQTYGVVKADLDHTLRVQVRAANEFGSSNAVSKATKVVTAAVVTPVAVTTSIAASTSTTTCCQSVRLTGTVSSGKAGEPIAIYGHEFDDIVDYPVTSTTSGDGGNWSVAVVPSAETSYYAQTSTSQSPAVTVHVHPRMGLGVHGNTFNAKITARDSFAGRVARFQTAGGPTGPWKTAALVVINSQSVASFHVTLTRGKLYYVRIYLPQVQAGTGYLDGTSTVRRVHGR